MEIGPCRDSPPAPKAVEAEYRQAVIDLLWKLRHQVPDVCKDLDAALPVVMRLLPGVQQTVSQAIQAIPLHGKGVPQFRPYLRQLSRNILLFEGSFTSLIKARDMQQRLGLAVQRRIVDEASDRLGNSSAIV